MAGQRVGLFGPHDHPAILACAAALVATGNRPLIRNENVFNPDPSHQEDFDAIVVIGESQAAERVMEAHESREITIYNIGANVGVTNGNGAVEEPLTESGAFLQFAERINASLVQQRDAIDASIAQLGSSAVVVLSGAADPSGSGLSEEAALGAHLCSILSRYAGERGDSEGAVEVLERIIAERDTAVLELAEDRELHRLQDEPEVGESLPKIADLAAHLETLDVDGVASLQARDTRKTAAALYEARIDALTKPKTE
jgi:hypothetical protein